MIRPLTLVTMLAAMGAGLHVYQTKHEVALLDRELRQIARAIEKQNERMLALSAEWALLNEPERLRQAAARHLALEPMQPAQFIRFAEMERRLPQAATFEGPPALFAAREDRGPGGEADAPLRLDIPERVPAPGLRISIAAAAAPTPPAPPEEAQSAATPVPARPSAPEALAAAPAPPAPAVAPIAVAAAAAAAAILPRPALAESPVERPQAAPRPTVTLAVAPRPAPRERQAPPAIAAPARAATLPPAPTLARATMPVAAPPPPAPSGGSLLGTARPMLAPPVPFGGANAATLGGATAVR